MFKVLVANFPLISSAFTLYVKYNSTINSKKKVVILVELQPNNSKIWNKIFKSKKLQILPY